MFSIWPQFGFRENPYDNQGLPGDETGDHLLVGRETEVAEVQRKIASAGTHPSVEGLAGVGKTSMLGRRRLPDDADDDRGCRRNTVCPGAGVLPGDRVAH